MKQPKKTTPAEAEQVLALDLKALKAKADSGTPLSPSERRILGAIAAGGNPESVAYAKNQSDLAAVLGVSRMAISRARRRPGNPGVMSNGSLDVAAWRAFLQATGTLGEASGEGGEQEEEASSAKILKERARNLLLKNQKLEAEIAVLRREWVPVEEIRSAGGQLASGIRKIVAQIHMCAQSVVGLSVPEAEARLREVEDEIMRQLNTLETPEANEPSR